MKSRRQKNISRVSVLLPFPFSGPLDYAVPEGLAPKPGDIVQVPLSNRRVIGVVWDPPPSNALPETRLKPMSKILDVPPLPASMRRFLDWVAAYTLASPGEVLAMSLKANALRAEPPRYGWQPAEVRPASARLTPARERVLAALMERAPLTTAELAQAADVSRNLVEAMAEAGLLVSVMLPRAPAYALPNPEYARPELSTEQREAAQALRQTVAARKFSVTLLEGVPGSGKTEVYFEAIAECIRLGRQALVLLPEIALSAQWLERFIARFGTEPAVWHSELGTVTRRRAWRAVAEGSARVVVGARSALFLPFPELGLVVVDEEHEAAFKQEDGVIYHARDMAIVRARFAAAPAVLVSATPSLESVTNAQAGRYRHLALKERHAGASLPQVAAIDLRAEPPQRGQFLSPKLIAAVAETLAKGEQAMLFLNRRGYAPLTLCRACGYRFACPNCTAWLVEHRMRRELLCHHCGHTQPMPQACPNCGAEQSLVPIGPGVERITEEAAMHLPEAKQLVMASDTIPGPTAAAQAARAVIEGKVNLIIGTQIVAKGWHFPLLTLVGVVDADLGLSGGDLRAAERTVQLLYQVAGRAGRAQTPGRVFLQTYAPEHPVMQALVAGDLGKFLACEAAARRPGNWPPFGRLAAIIVSAKTASEADAVAAALGQAAPRAPGITVLGPAPAPLAVLRGWHRRRLLLKTQREIMVQPLLRDWLSAISIPRSVRIAIDVDPISFL
jgi:primosomal protein N' (replication factor Y)